MECDYCRYLRREHTAEMDPAECKSFFMRRKYAQLAATAIMLHDDCDGVDLEAIDRGALEAGGENDPIS